VAVAERLKLPQDHEEDKASIQAESKQDGEDGGAEEESFVKLERNLEFCV
jgi:hypothetical protein